MKRALWILLFCGWPGFALASPSEGFRAGFRMPVGIGDQRLLVPGIGLGVETRLDTGSNDFPISFAFICSYDEFVFLESDLLGGGNDFILAESQSLSYSSFVGAATFRYGVGRFLAHAELGPGVSVGFFHGVATATDPEVFVTEFLLGATGGAGLAFSIGEKGVIDLSARYQKTFLNNKLVTRGDNTLRVFHDFLSFGLTAGYLF